MAKNTRYSGRFADVSLGGVSVGQPETWSITCSDTLSDPIPWRGGSIVQEGARDWSGEFTTRNPAPLAFVGDEIDFLGYVDSSTKVAGGSGPTFSGKAIIETIQVAFDYTTNTPVATTYTFAGNGELKQSTGTITSSDPLLPVSSRTAIISIAPLSLITGATEGECWMNWRTFNMTFSCPSAVFDIDSCSEGNWTTREPGSTLSWNASLVVDTVEEQFLPPYATPFELDIDLKGYTPGWKIKHVLRQNASGPSIDKSSSASINRTLDLQWSATDDTTVGIIQFGSKTYWPYT